MKTQKKIEAGIHIAGLSLILILCLLWHFADQWMQVPRAEYESLRALSAYSDSLMRAEQARRQNTSAKKSNYKKSAPASAKPVVVERVIAEPKIKVEASANQEEKAATPEYASNLWKLELNAADSAALVQIKGIGPYFARKIIAYRDRLGGFVNTLQLDEIEGIAPERLSAFKNNLRVDSLLIRTIDFNTDSEEILGSHPYIGPYLARSIVLWRNSTPNKKCNPETLLLEGIIPKNLFQKIRPYSKN